MGLLPGGDDDLETLFIAASRGETDSTLVFCVTYFPFEQKCESDHKIMIKNNLN